MLGASPRSAGKAYSEAVNWKLADDIPEGVSKITVRTCEPTGPFTECDVVFSGLDADVAGDIGMSDICDLIHSRNGIFESKYTYLLECEELSKSGTYSACGSCRQHITYHSITRVATEAIRIE